MDKNTDSKMENALFLVLQQISEIIKNIKNGILVFFTNSKMVINAKKYLSLPRFKNINEKI